LLDLGVTADVVHKSGAFFSYNDERLGQGRAAARQFLREHPEISDDIERQIRDRAGLPAAPTPPPVAPLKGQAAAAAAAALVAAEAEAAKAPGSAG
jgi:recombination protein RecA